jgi:hypothetical protein
MTRSRPLSDFIQILTGPVIWFAHFIVLYGAEALICTPPFEQPSTMMWISAASTLGAIGALGAFATFAVRRPSDTSRTRSAATFLRAASLLLALLSAIAVIWVALPTLVLPVCAPAAG